MKFHVFASKFGIKTLNIIDFEHIQRETPQSAKSENQKYDNHYDKNW